MAAVSSGKVSVKWSLFYVVVSIILTYVYQFLNLDMNSSIKYIGFIPFIAFMLLAQKEYRDQLGYSSFGESFMIGFKYTLLTTLLGSIFTYIYFTLLSPQVFQTMVDGARQQAEAKGGELPAIFNTPGIYLILGAMLTLFAGAIIALIGAAIFKKDKPLFFAEDPANYTDPVV